MPNNPSPKGQDKTYNYLVGSPIELFRTAARYALGANPQELARYTTPWALQEKYPIDPRHVLRAVSGVDSPQTIVALRKPALVLTAGATGAFNLLLRHFKSIYDQYQQICEEIRTPVILTTSPTYGAFVELARLNGFEMQDIPLVDKNFKFSMTPESLEARLDELHQDPNRFVVAFVDTSPHNPTGRVRTRTQTEELACVLSNYQEIRGRILLQSLDATRSDFADAFATISPLINLPIIDDLAYFGLEYRGLETHSFVTVPGVAQHTHVLLTASKLGLPALRVGSILTNASMADDLTVMSYRSYDSPSIPVARAAQAVWSMAEPFNAERTRHLQRQRLLYRRNAQLVEALINGINQTVIDPADKAWINRKLKPYFEKADPDRLAALKESGIPGLSVATAGQKAGFFHILSFDPGTWTPLVERLAPAVRFFEHHENRMNRLLKEWGITMLPSSWMFLPSSASNYRISFARPAEDLVDFATCLMTMTEGCVEKAKITPVVEQTLPEGIRLVDVERPLPHGLRRVGTRVLDPVSFFSRVRVSSAPS